MSLGLLYSSLRTIKNLPKNIQVDKVLDLVSSRISDDDEDYSHIKRKKGKLELILLSCAVCGIEFCYAAETAFVSPTLLKIGVPVLYMTLIWCLSPLLGFILVPFFGSMSDRCRSRFGRRRPFIVLLSVGIVLGLLLVPNGQTIGKMLGDRYVSQETEDFGGSTSPTTLYNTSVYESTEVVTDLVYNTTQVPETMGGWSLERYRHPFSILFTVLGVVMLDFSCDACQSPCRAYLLDVTVPEDHSAGLSTFTVMAGLGGSLGYVMGGINWEKTHFGESLGGHVRVVFTLVLFIYVICLGLTLSSVKEVPLDRLGVTKEDLQRKRKRKDGGKYRKFTNEDDTDEEAAISECETHEQPHMNMMEQNGKVISGLTPSKVDSSTFGDDLKGYGSIERGGRTDDFPVDHVTQEIPHEGLPLPSEVSLKQYLLSIVHMPKSLIILCVTNLFCWMSLVCYSLYFTDFVGQAVYGGDPSAPPYSPQHKLYEEGVRMGSFGMSLYSLSCSIVSLCMEKLVNKVGAKPVYICGQLVYTLGAALISLLPHRAAVILLSPCAGVMYATLFTMPYLLVAHYHSNDTFEELSESRGKQSKQIRGLGTDIALVSSMVFVAQFILSACMGSIVHAVSSTKAVMVSAAVLSFCGSLMASQVLYLDL